MTRTNVGRSIFITLVSQLVLYAQGLIVMPIAIKLAGETVYGSYVLILNMLTTAYGLSSLGAGYNFRRKLAAVSDQQERLALFEPQFSFQTLNLAIVSGLFLAGGTWLQHAMFGPSVHLSAWIVPLWLLTYLLYSQVADYFRYSMRFIHFNLIGLYPILFVALVALYALALRRISLNALILIQVAAYAVVTIPLLVMMLREVGFFRFRLPWAVLRNDIAIGYPLTLQFLADILIGYSDRYIILLYLTVADVGRYQPAYQLAALATFFPKVAGVVLAPALSRYVDLGESAAARNLADNFVRLFLMVAIPFVAGTSMIGPSLIALLASPDVAHASRWVGPFVAIATIFNGIALVAFQIAFVLGRTKTVLHANIIGSAINIGLNLLILYFVRDITVPAMVAAISYIACCTVAIWSLRDIWTITIRAKPALQFVIASLGMITLLLLLGYRPGAILVEPMSQLLVHVAFGIVAYGGFLAAIGGVDRQDIRQFRAIFRREAKVADA